LIGSSPQVSETNVERASALGNAVNYATTIQHQRTTKQTSGTCCLTSEIDIWLTGIGTGLTNRVLNSVVDVEGKLKISSSVDNTVSNIQQLICINPNDSLYSKEEVNNYNNDYHNILNTKSYESNFIV
jgi:hypothetical protein